MKVFIRYNANKALQNLGFDPLSPDTAEDVDPIVMNGISTGTSNHDFFSQVGNGYLLVVEAMDDEDYSKWMYLLKQVPKRSLFLIGWRVIQNITYYFGGLHSGDNSYTVLSLRSQSYWASKGLYEINFEDSLIPSVVVAIITTIDPKSLHFLITKYGNLGISFVK